MVAGTEVDHDVEAPVLEGELAHVGGTHLDLRTRAHAAPPRDLDQRAVDVNAHEYSGAQPSVQHGKRDTTTTAHLEDAATHGKMECPEHERDLEALLKSVARFHVPERDICLALR